jgi:hypothetical protein
MTCSVFNRRKPLSFHPASTDRGTECGAHFKAMARRGPWVCGIAGIASDNRLGLRSRLAMRDFMKHRGPDDAGVFVGPFGVGRFAYPPPGMQFGLGWSHSSDLTRAS